MSFKFSAVLYEYLFQRARIGIQLVDASVGAARAYSGTVISGFSVQLVYVFEPYVVDSPFADLAGAFSRAYAASVADGFYRAAVMYPDRSGIRCRAASDSGAPAEHHRVVYLYPHMTVPVHDRCMRIEMCLAAVSVDIASGYLYGAGVSY